MPHTVAVAFVGVSHYHARDWVTAVADHPLADLIGVWDRDPALADSFAREAGTTSWSSRADLLAAADAVAIASVTTDHADDVVASVAAGCHVLLEKPPAASLEEFAEARAAIEGSGIVFAQNFPKRLDPASIALRHLVHSGGLGPVSVVRIRHGHSQAWDEAFRRAWFADPARAGGGALLDEGIHTLDFCRWLFGEPSSVFAQVSSPAGLSVEDTAVISLEYADGPLVSITTSWSMAGARGSIEIHGRDGSAELTGVDMASAGLGSPPLAARVRRRAASESSERRWEDLGVTPVFTTGGFHGLGVTNFLEAVTGAGAPSAGLEDALAALRLVRAAYDSHESGRKTWLS